VIVRTFLCIDMIDHIDVDILLMTLHLEMLAKVVLYEHLNIKLKLNFCYEF